MARNAVVVDGFMAGVDCCRRVAWDCDGAGRVNVFWRSVLGSAVSVFGYQFAVPSVELDFVELLAYVKPRDIRLARRGLPDQFSLIIDVKPGDDRVHVDLFNLSSGEYFEAELPQDIYDRAPFPVGDLVYARILSARIEIQRAASQI